jgi:TRAP transporter TAXI family solute receptor
MDLSRDPATPNNDPCDQAFAAYLKSCDAGEAISREAFLAQFPELADQLSDLLDAADAIQRISSGQSGSADDPDETTCLKINSTAETIIGQVEIDGRAAANLDATLPLANRAADDPGPTLPYDLGDYILLEVLGRGGMGVVYLAKQKELDREVAVKMIRSGMLADEAEVRRFYTEAQAVARLHHRGIVAVHQFGCRAGHHFFSMEYVPGTDLERLINAGVLPTDVAARYVRDIALAIHHAHEKGVLHRDLKPANVLIDLNDQVRVTDFGLAKQLDADSSVTGSGTAVGTPHYMAPEQAGGYSDRASHESDVYALGAILFACLTGRPPIVAETVMQTLLNVVHVPAPAVRVFRPDVSVDLETIVAKCLEKKPDKRYATAQQLADDLNAYLTGRPIQARPRNRAMKVWQWLEGVPVVGALTGRRMLDTSVSHRRFQTLMLLLLCVTPIMVAGLLTVSEYRRQAMPAIVRLAGGVESGRYNEVSKRIAARLQAKYPVDTFIAPSSGSLDNRQRLLIGQVDLAPMQATAISGDQLCVVAPLFYELLYVLVRPDSNIQSLADLRGHAVAVGPEGSGSLATADLVLDSYGLSDALVPRRMIGWDELPTNDTVQAAMICIGRGSPLVSGLLQDHDWRLIPIPDGIRIALEHPTLRAMSIPASEFPELSLAAGGVPTVGTTAFLAAEITAPAALVHAVLTTLYQPPEMVVGLISRAQAAEWQGLALHPEARRYYEQVPPAVD